MQNTTTPDRPARSASPARASKLLPPLAIASLGAVVLWSWTALAAPTPAPAVPHTFVANAPARAGEVNDNFTFVANGMMPAGGIIMWSGSVDDIPEGWALCDGGNGTPDLQSRFIVGAGPGGTPAYVPHDSAGPDNHSHDVVVPNRSVTTSSNGAHTHKFPTSWYRRKLGVGLKTGIDTGGHHPEDQTTQSSGSHAHSVTVPGVSITSVPYTGQNRPKWYALSFIMKLPHS